MKIKKTFKIFAIAILFTSTAQPVAAQDFLARQAPIDRKMKAVDTLMVKSITQREQQESPAAELYEDWDNKYAHKASELPDKFTINLKNFCMPTTSRVVTSNFGYRWGRQHKGLDIKVYIGDTIRAAFSGKVRIVRYEGGGYGKYIVIRHPNGLETIYGHLSKQLVSENQEVRAGEVIGLGGNTGRSTGSHLHFETRLCGVALNPALMFDFRAQDVTGDTYTFNSNTYNRESAEASRVRGKIGNGGYSEDEVRSTSANSRNSSQEDVFANTSVQYHQVGSGETLYSIARKYNTTVEELCKLNHFSKNARVRKGQIIKYS